MKWSTLFFTSQGWTLQHLVQHLFQPLLQVVMMDSFGLVMPAMGTIAVTSTVREEWRCVSMEHLEQSVMWAGTSWMPKWLAVNLASMVSSHYITSCMHAANLETRNHHLYRVTSVEQLQSCSMVRLCLSGECVMQWHREGGVSVCHTWSRSSDQSRVL